MSSEFPPVIDANSLHQVLGRPRLKTVAVANAADFEAAHLPGALRLDYQALIGEAPPAAGPLPDPDRLAERLGAIGLARDDDVVAYDHGAGTDAARLLFSLDLLDHPRAALLDGGLAAWNAAGLPTESGAVMPKSADYHGRVIDGRVAHRDEIQARLDQVAADEKPLKLLDVRSPQEYAGTDLRSARGGHIPGAANLEWQAFKTDEDRLRPREEVLQLLAERGITPDDEVVVYCQSHRRSAYAYWALKASGFDRVRAYPGSWSEWGNLDDTPIHTSAGNERMPHRPRPGLSG